MTSKRLNNAISDGWAMTIQNSLQKAHIYLMNERQNPAHQKTHTSKFYRVNKTPHIDFLLWTKLHT